MGTIDKNIKQLFEATDGITAYKKVNSLKQKCNNENRKIIIDSLIKYIQKGRINKLEGFILGDILELVEENEKYYASFFKECINSGYENKSYWGIKGYVKTNGEDSYEFLSRIVLDNRASIKNKWLIIKELAKHSNNTFDKHIPKDIDLLKENKIISLERKINYLEFEDWIFSGYEKGNGYDQPLRHISLDNPQNEREIIMSEIDKKLKKIRDKKQDLSNPTNWLALASSTDIARIMDKWKLPEIYLTFLKIYSPINAELNNKDYGLVSIYGAHNLIKKQDGYSYNSVTKRKIREWNKNFLVIADSVYNPFCIDITLENSPVYFAYHGTGKWNFEKAYESFYDFLKSFI